MRGALAALAVQPGELGEERDRDGDVHADADAHHEACGDQRPHVLRESAHQRGGDEEEHVRHEDAVAADAVHQPAADESAEERTDADRGGDRAGHSGAEAELLRDVGQPVGQGTQVVGVEEDAAERDDHDHLGVAAARRTRVDQIGDVGRGADQHRARRRHRRCAGGQGEVELTSAFRCGAGTYRRIVCTVRNSPVRTSTSWSSWWTPSRRMIQAVDVVPTGRGRRRHPAFAVHWGGAGCGDPQSVLPSTE